MTPKQRPTQPKRTTRVKVSGDAIVTANTDQPAAIRGSSGKDRAARGGAPDERISFDGQQQALLRVLMDMSEDIANMYIGALMARQAEHNPDHLSQACHSLRELIDNVPKYFDVPVESAGRLGDHVSALITRWKRESRVRNGNDEAVSEGFLREFAAFVEWQESNFPKRREIARRTIQEFDASGRSLPERIEELHAQEWMEIRGFFVQATHHASCTLDEFDQWIDEFETFLLSKARPQTFRTADRIDALIREGEADA